MSVLTQENGIVWAGKAIIGYIELNDYNETVFCPREGYEISKFVMNELLALMEQFPTKH